MIGSLVDCLVAADIAHDALGKDIYSDTYWSYWIDIFLGHDSLVFEKLNYGWH